MLTALGRADKISLALAKKSEQRFSTLTSSKAAERETGRGELGVVEP
jgi:hypothetical protein